jgi:hypothetical protein
MRFLLGERFIRLHLARPFDIGSRENWATAIQGHDTCNAKMAFAQIRSSPFSRASR